MPIACRLTNRLSAVAYCPRGNSCETSGLIFPSPNRSQSSRTFWRYASGALARATAAVRDKLAADPVDLAIGLADVKIVAADSHTLAPPLYVGDIPAAEATLLALMS